MSTTRASRSRWMPGASSRRREDADGPVLEELSAGGRRAHPAGAAAGEELAGPALRADPDVRWQQLGPGAVRARGEPRDVLVPRAPGPPERRRAGRHALRDGLDDARQLLARSLVPHPARTREAQT